MYAFSNHDKLVADPLHVVHLHLVSRPDVLVDHLGTRYVVSRAGIVDKDLCRRLLPSKARCEQTVGELATILCNARYLCTRNNTDDPIMMPLLTWLGEPA
jgi:hypothetical protein